MLKAVNNISYPRQRRSINYRMLLRVMGILVLIESVFMLAPMFVALYYGENDWLAFLLAAVITSTAGASAAFFSKPTTHNMGRREGYLLTTMTWVVFSVFGMLPFLISPAEFSVADAFTEAMSDFTTTGTPMVPDVEVLSHGVNIWRAVMQWTGGMGIILFTLAVIPMLNHTGGIQMFNAESTGITHDKISPRISGTAKSLWITYVLLTLSMFLLLMPSSLDTADSIYYSLVTMATGGGCAHNAGIIYAGSNYVKIIATVFMFFGSVNFTLLFKVATGQPGAMRGNGTLKPYLILILSFIAIFMVSEYASGKVLSFSDSLIDTSFVVLAATSSTGFSLPGIESWGAIVLVMLPIMMFFGGCAGSTSGGAKIDRMLVLFKYSRNEVWRALQPNSVPAVKIGSKTLQYELVQKVIAFLCLDVIIVLLSTIALTVLGLGPVDALYSSIGCISNSMMSLNLGEYGGMLSQMPWTCKMLLSFVMLTGRLEIYTVLVLFTRSFWHR